MPPDKAPIFVIMALWLGAKSRVKSYREAKPVLSSTGRSTWLERESASWAIVCRWAFNRTRNPVGDIIAIILMPGRCIPEGNSGMPSFPILILDGSRGDGGGGVFAVAVPSDGGGADGTAAGSD